MDQARRDMASNLLALQAQCRAAARAAGLRYVDDRNPGIRRERKRGRFVFFDPLGRRIGEARLLARIRALAVPPAWTNVWICPYDNGHLQATGRDARGRKQYRYHRAWSEARGAAKHGRMCEFAARLADLRTHCDHTLQKRGLSRDKVMAALLRIVDLTAIRVGHEEYARSNASFGLTTLRTKHARVRGSEVELRFRGKSGIMRTLRFRDARLAKVVAACRALGGPQLFQYRDALGARRRIDAYQLNTYLHSLIGPTFSVKDFRTWAATVRVAVDLSASERAASQRAAKKVLLEAIRNAAAHLGNTPTVCRNSYVHPLVVDAYLIGKTLPVRVVAEKGDYRAHEQAVRQFLLRLIREPRLKPETQRVASKRAA